MSSSSSPLRSPFSLLSTCISKPKTKETDHHVFISFSGDNRSGFTSHLEASLTRHGIRTFLDYKMERGDNMFSTLLRAVKGSKISVIVFSKDYATSEWCLDELVEIMSCMREKTQIVIPIFYGINPSDVRRQSGIYEDAFAGHEISYGRNIVGGRVRRWRNAMTEAANLSGWDSSAYGTESRLVEEIAIDVREKLDKYYREREPEIAWQARQHVQLLSIQS